MVERKWRRIAHGLRARPAENGVDLQGVRNFRVAHGDETVEIKDCEWQLNDAALVELFILASSWRSATEREKNMVRAQLLRVLHGEDKP